MDAYLYTAWLERGVWHAVTLGLEDGTPVERIEVTADDLADLVAELRRQLPPGAQLLDAAEL